VTETECEKVNNLHGFALVVKPCRLPSQRRNLCEGSILRFG